MDFFFFFFEKEQQKLKKEKQFVDTKKVNNAEVRELTGCQDF